MNLGLSNCSVPRAKQMEGGFPFGHAIAPSILNRISSCLAIALLLFAGCSPDSPPGFKEANVPVSPETLKPYSAIFASSNQNRGFPPLPTNGTVRILTVDRAGWKREYPPPIYDVSLQFYTGSNFFPYTSRFIALKRLQDGYNVVSEQMTFNGPRRYQAGNATINESVSILNETQQIAVTGTNIAGTVIAYRGPDRRFGTGNSPDVAGGLKPSDIGPLLREWGYDYVVDRVPAGGTSQEQRPLNSETNRTP